MENTKRRNVKKYIFYALVCVLALLISVLPFILDSAKESTEHKAGVFSATAEKGGISSTVAGTGTLTAQEAVTLSVPDGVLLEEFLVDNGDIVAEGDAVALTDRVSVMETISLVQENLEYLQEQMQDASGEQADNYVTSPVSGTVREIYAQPGDDVRQVMLEHGALALISTDGLMAAQLDCTGAYFAGDALTVLFSDGSERPASVKSNLDGVLTLTLPDEGWREGESVTVKDAQGRNLGSAELYVHNAWRATAFSGTVSSVYLKEGYNVYSGSTLFYLSSTGYTAQLELLAQQHREYENVMFELFLMYQDGVLRAPASGEVSSIEENSALLLSSRRGGLLATLLANAPNGNDEQGYTNRVGMLSSQNDDGSWQLLLQDGTVSVDDYTQLSAVNTSKESMVIEGNAALSAPLYSFTGGSWQQGGTLAAGDVLLFSYDESGSLVWMIYLGHHDVQQPPTGGDGGGESEDGDDDGDETPGLGGAQGGGHTPSGGSSGMSGFGGSTQQQDEFTMLSLEGISVLSVTPLEELTVSFTVDELDILSLSVGQSAKLTIDALPGQSFDGQVREISSSESSRKYSVTVAFPRQDKMISGMNASVIITVESREDVLCIPVKALLSIDGSDYVYLSYDEREKCFGGLTELETGISDGENVEIISGLSEGDVYWYSYYDTAEDAVSFSLPSP